jgi:hypothetical protein
VKVGRPGSQPPFLLVAAAEEGEALLLILLHISLPDTPSPTKKLNINNKIAQSLCVARGTKCASFDVTSLWCPVLAWRPCSR